jgi:hypothetical protein
MSTPEPTPLPKPKRKLHRVRLTVTADLSSLAVRPMNEEEQTASKTLLAELQAVDDERAACAAAKSSLEAYIYASRAKMGDLSEEVEGVSTEEQREAISTALETVEEWLYEEGDETDVPTYLGKHNELKDLVIPVLARVHEAGVRAKVVRSAEDFIAATKATLADWNESRPWVSALQQCVVCVFSCFVCVLLPGWVARRPGRAKAPWLGRYAPSEEQFSAACCIRWAALVYSAVWHKLLAQLAA